MTHRPIRSLPTALAASAAMACLAAVPLGKVVLPGQSALPAPQADIVVIPMHGPVGQDATEAEWIDGEAVGALFDQAKRMSPKYVVLDIESPGGLVSVMRQIGETMVRKFPKDGKSPQLVAWPGMAASAASFITLSCPTIVVKPTARVGAALTIMPTREGWVAVDDLPGDKSGYAQKMKSFSDASERVAIQYGGHPQEVRDAMAQQASQLWWSPSARRFSATPPDPKNKGDWTCIDDATKVLTMTSAEMRGFGLARAECPDQAGLPAALGLKPDSKVVVLGKELPDWFASVRKAIDPLATDYSEFGSQLTLYANSLSDVIRLETDLANTTIRLRAYKDGDRDRDPIQAKQNELSRMIAKARASAGSAVKYFSKLVESADRAEKQLDELHAELAFVPMALVKAPQIMSSIKAYKRGDAKGALSALSAPGVGGGKH